MENSSETKGNDVKVTEFVAQKAAFEMWLQNSGSHPTLFDAWLNGQTYILGRIKIKVE